MKQKLMTLFLMSLTACSPKIKYVKPDIPDLPPKPQYYPVKFYKVDENYCMTEENAINLLKNIELMRGYTEELEIILKGLNDDSK